MAFGVIGMLELLREIREPEKGKGTLNDLAVSCGVLALGIALGILAKWLDALAIDDAIWWQNLIGRFNLGIVFSDFGIWMMLAVVISVKSRSPLWAALRVLLFFAGMTVSYHWYSVHVCGFDPLEYMKIWYTIAALSPIPAFVCWYAGGSSGVSMIIKALILVVIVMVTLMKRFWDISIYRLPDVLICLTTFLVLYRKD